MCHPRGVFRADLTQRGSTDEHVDLLWQIDEFDRTRKALDTEGTPEYQRRKLVCSHFILFA